MIIGLLALQGDYDAHRKILEQLGVETRLVRQPRDLEAVDGLVIPGGESTVMSRLCDRYGLREPLQARLRAGFPAFGTCAGLIFLAKEIEGGSENFRQTTLGVLDATVARNAYGAQIESFEADVPLKNSEATIHAIFIRAPQIRAWGPSVEVLAEHEGMPVLVRQGHMVASSFHPEIVGESRVHQLWLEAIARSS